MKWKSVTLGSAALAFLALPVSAAGVFYSFDSTLDGTGAFNGSTTAKTANATASEGFGTPALTYAGSIHSADMVGGAASFTAYNGTTWLGSGGTGAPGHSLVWNPNSTGNTFSLTISTLNLTNLVIRLDARAGNSGGANLAGFSSFTYAINGTNQGAVGANPAFANVTTYQQWSVDLSTATGGAINNQNEVTLTWNIPNLGGNQSLRLDNLQITAIPEPASVALLGLAACVPLVRRRR